jgi:hypothetical protein
MSELSDPFPYPAAVRLRESHAELLAAAKGLLRFNEELCADINVSKHYPSAEKARAAIAKAEASEAADQERTAAAIAGAEANAP